jgi:hypothetical protein
MGAALIGEREEAQPMTEFVQQHDQRVDLATGRIGVVAVFEADAAAEAAHVDAAVDGGGDFGCRAVLVGAQQLIGQRGREGGTARRTDAPADDQDRQRGAGQGQHGTIGVAGQVAEPGGHTGRHGAVEGADPDARRAPGQVHPLLPGVVPGLRPTGVAGVLWLKPRPASIENAAALAPCARFARSIIVS